MAGGGARAGAGRPRYTPTRERRAMVERLAARGESQERIASALGVDAGTLKKHFANELTAARERRRAERTCPTCGATLKRHAANMA